MRGRRRVLVGVVSGVVVAVAAVGIGGRSLGWFGGSRSGCDDPSAQQTVNPPQAGPAPEVNLPASAVRTIATGLCAPWGLAFLPDGTALVTERDTTRILSVTPAGQVTEVQRVTQARPGGKGGLLGIAVSPNYASDRWIYIYYNTDTDNRIARLRLREEPQPILTGIPARDFHQGGRIAFGPDAMLYVTVGDTYEQPHLAQDRSSLAGKILRITPEGKPAPGNPFPGSASGAWGTATSKAWPGTPKGALRQRVRSGPPRRAQLDPTGRQLRLAGRGGEGNDSRFVDPIVTWAPAEASPSGITVLDDRIYIACLRAERLYR